MKIGDLIKFKGTWGSKVVPGERKTGTVMQVWTNGRTGVQQSCDVLWDNGEYGLFHGVNQMEVISEAR